MPECRGLIGQSNGNLPWIRAGRRRLTSYDPALDGNQACPSFHERDGVGPRRHRIDGSPSQVRLIRGSWTEHLAAQRRQGETYS